MALTIKSEIPSKPKEFVLLSKWDAVFGSFQSFQRACVFILDVIKSHGKTSKSNQRRSVQSVSCRGDCALLAAQSQAESRLPRTD